MTFNNQKKTKWLEINREYILKWKATYAKLFNQSLKEWWTTEQLEREIGSSLPDAELRDLWFFATSYVATHPGGQLGKELKTILKEIKEHGTLEPSIKRKFLKAMETSRRKKYGK